MELVNAFEHRWGKRLYKFAVGEHEFTVSFYEGDIAIRGTYGSMENLTPEIKNDIILKTFMIDKYCKEKNIDPELFTHRSLNRNI